MAKVTFQTATSGVILAKLGSMVYGRIYPPAGNDRNDFWYEATFSPNPVKGCTLALAKEELAALILSYLEQKGRPPSTTHGAGVAAEAQPSKSPARTTAAGVCPLCKGFVRNVQSHYHEVHERGVDRETREAIRSDSAESPSTPRSNRRRQSRYGDVNDIFGSAYRPGTRAPNPAFVVPATPDAALAAIIGPEPRPRTDITKAVWAYIKQHGLQDPSERRMINADERLRAIFDGKSRLSMFEMTKCVNKHLSS